MVLYRDGTGDLVARNLETGAVFRQAVDFENEVISQAMCSPDGSRIATLKLEFSNPNRTLDIRGGKPLEIEVPSSVQDLAWSPDGTRIVTAAWDGIGQVHELAVLDVATGESAPLETGPGYLSAVNWSPDGDRIAYYVQNISTGESDIFVYDLASNEARQLTGEEDISWFDPTWAPGGESLVIAGQSPEAAQLYRIDAETGEVTQLTESEDIYRRGPEYSPEGAMIAYTGSIIAPAVSATAVALHQFGIFLIDPDGSNERPFTQDPRENPGANVDPYLDAFLMGWCVEGPWLDDLWTEESS